MRGAGIDMLGVRINTIGSAALLELFRGAIGQNERKIFAYVNAHALNLSRKLPWFRSFLNDAAAVYPDGEGVRLGAKILGKRLPAVTALTRWIWEIGSFCEENGWSLYLLGSTSEYSERAGPYEGKIYAAPRFPSSRIFIG